MWEELFNGLTEERIAKEEGVEFTEEQLEAVSGEDARRQKHLAHAVGAPIQSFLAMAVAATSAAAIGDQTIKT